MQQVSKSTMGKLEFYVMARIFRKDFHIKGGSTFRVELQIVTSGKSIQCT